MRQTMWGLVGVLVLATGCGQSSSSSSSSTSSGGGGAQCTPPGVDCPGGFKCLAGQCVTQCPVNNITTGCVVGSQCVAGTCVKNTTCSETQGCAYDKGEVCDFASGTCVVATERCTEGEMETLCTNGLRCHVSVCYANCEGQVGCATGMTCTSHACQ